MTKWTYFLSAKVVTDISRMQVFARYALRGNIRTFQVPRIVLTVLLVNTWKTMEVIGGYTSWSCLVPCVLLELPPTFLVQVGVPIVHPGSSAAHSAAHNARHAPQGMLSGRALHHASSAQAAMGQIPISSLALVVLLATFQQWAHAGHVRAAGMWLLAILVSAMSATLEHMPVPARRPLIV